MKNKLFILMLIACYSALLASCCCGSNKSETPKKIEVIGSAEMEIVPNEIYMNFTLKEYLDAARNKVKIEKIKTDFLKLCKDAGVVDSCISIASYTGNERWDYYWYVRRKREPDFMSSITYSIIVSSPEKIDKIVSGINDNAVENFSIVKTSHSEIEKLRKEVKTNAIIATKTKAEYLAASIGEDLGDALSIQEINDTYRYYSPESNMSNTISQSSTSYESQSTAAPNFQKIKLRYEMKAEFELK
jgi:uncharacterized protein YggE